MKKLFFCLALFFLFSLLFQKQIIGYGVKTICKIKYDCNLSFREISVKNRSIHFKNAVLFHPSFHTYAEGVSVYFSFPGKLKAEILIEKPTISIHQLPIDISAPSKQNWLDLDLFVQNGKVDWEGPIGFELSSKKGVTQIHLDLEDKYADIKIENKKIVAELKNFSLNLINPWIDFFKIVSGNVTGIVSYDEAVGLQSANLKFQKGDILFGKAEMNDLQGSFSYNKDVGGKWEISGLGKAKDKYFPILCSGRGFFKSSWFETKIDFDEAWCKISGDEEISFECSEISHIHASAIQSLLLYFEPGLHIYELESGQFTGKAIYSPSYWEAQFASQNICLMKDQKELHLINAEANLSKEGGYFFAKSDDVEIVFDGKWESWIGSAKVLNGEFELSGSIQEDRLPIKIIKGKYEDLLFSGDGWIDANFDLFFSIKGDFSLFDQKIPFSCPMISKIANAWNYDVQIDRKTWDLCRIKGKFEDEKFSFNEGSHLLGSPIVLKEGHKDHLKVGVDLSSESIHAIAPILSQFGISNEKIPNFEPLKIEILFKDQKVCVEAQSESPKIDFHLVKSEGKYEINLESDLKLSTTISKNEKAHGYVEYKDEFKTDFEGKITPAFLLDLELKNTSVNLSKLKFWPVEGMAQGEGHFFYKDDKIETDFDFEVEGLKVQSFALNSKEKIHLDYHSDRGALFKGIDVHGAFDCQVGFLEYDLQNSKWLFSEAKIHLPPSFLTHKFFNLLDQKRDLNFIADLEFDSDFSNVSCKMREGIIPYKDADHLIENLDLIYKSGKCIASFTYLDEKIDLNLQIDEKIEGRVAIGKEENPLKIDWIYDQKLFIQSIQGAFHGIDAAFHAESPNLLVGSAHLNFNHIKDLLPKDVSLVFDEIKMGDGYEIKGRLKIEENQPFFEGILSGKAIELFGFQFRTLLARVSFAMDQIRIFDVKISDTAGSMKIDEIYLVGKNENPWTISIPNLKIQELRPSMLVSSNKTQGPMTPLVIRELNIYDFKGLLDDGKTYTAKGDLNFINSYKRQDTVFDIPANVLNRIVGLDFELLIPVKGDLTFEIKDGYFNLLDLENAFSEAERSQFFLEMDPPPRMDLDGNLEIYIKMKQFVLLKITESFLISIDGALDDPKFHLKRKRFFGLI